MISYTFSNLAAAKDCPTNHLSETERERKKRKKKKKKKKKKGDTEGVGSIDSYGAI